VVDFDRILVKSFKKNIIAIIKFNYFLKTCADILTFSLLRALLVLSLNVTRLTQKFSRKVMLVELNIT